MIGENTTVLNDIESGFGELCRNGIVPNAQLEPDQRSWPTSAEKLLDMVGQSFRPAKDIDQVELPLPLQQRRSNRLTPEGLAD